MVIVRCRRERFLQLELYLSSGKTAIQFFLEEHESASYANKKTQLGVFIFLV